MLNPYADKQKELHTGSVGVRVNNDRHRDYGPTGCRWKICYCWCKEEEENTRKERSPRTTLKQKVKNTDIKIATLNVGSMTRKGYEMVEMMESWKLDVLCVQETKWKASKARNLGGGYELYYHGVDSRRNGVGIILKEEWTSGVIEVSRVPDRIMHMRVELGRNIVNIVSAV